MGKLGEIRELLEKIQRSNSKQRVVIIRKVQNIISDDTIALNNDLQQELAELGNELYDYEQSLQQGDVAEERLLEKVSAAIENLDGFLEDK